MNVKLNRNSSILAIVFVFVTQHVSTTINWIIDSPEASSTFSNDF